MVSRSRGRWIGSPPDQELRGWDHDRAAGRANQVRTEFERPELKPFDVGHLFWASWKWIGWFGTEFTWVNRWIMDSVIRRDARAVNLCNHWLREGTVSERQSRALRYALNLGSPGFRARHVSVNAGSLVAIEEQVWVGWLGRRSWSG